MSDIPVHPAAAVFPMLSDDELAELAEDIKANGLLHPILRDADGVLIDGRNRLAACERVGVQPRFEVYEGDPVALIVSANISRRHLNKSQRAMALARMERTLDTQYPSRAAARLIDSAHALVVRARYVLHNAPDLVGQVEAGASLNDAYRVATERKRGAEALEATRRKRLAYLEQERDRVIADIEAGRQLMGPRVQIPPEPELEVTFTQKPDGGAKMPDPAPALGENLKREQALSRRLQAIKREVADLAAEPIIEDAWHFEGHVMAIRSWASQIVAAVYGMVEAHNAALAGGSKMRRVK